MLQKGLIIQNNGIYSRVSLRGYQEVLTMKSHVPPAFTVIMGTRWCLEQMLTG